VGYNSCLHGDLCECDLKVDFADQLRIPSIYVTRDLAGKQRTTEEIIQSTIYKIESSCEWLNNMVLCKRKRNVVAEIVHTASIDGFTNIRFVPCFGLGSLSFESSPVRMMDPRTEKTLREADVSWFSQYGIRENLSWYEDVWRPYLNHCPWKKNKGPDESIMSLKVLAARVASPYNMAIGTTNGRPHVISSMDNLSNEKIAAALRKKHQPTDVITPAMREAIEVIPEALNYMVNTMGLEDKLRTQDPTVSFERCEGMYLGAAAGSFVEQAHAYKLELKEGEEVEDVTLVSKASQKKIHSHEAVLKSVANFASGLPPIAAISTQNMKNELYTSLGEKQADDALWRPWIHKLRLYEIPNQFTILIERICHTTRKQLETGPCVSIGMKWSRAGMDKMAERLGVLDQFEHLKTYDDGDFNGMDVHTNVVYMDFFDSFALAYFRPDHPHYPIMRRMVKYISEHSSVRILRYFGDLVAIIIGQMESGRWMTSHGNSFNGILWYFMFQVYHIKMQPLEKRAFIEQQLIEKVTKLIIYGDDQIQTQNRSILSHTFNMRTYAAFLKKHVGMEMRDVRVDVPFCASVRKGFAVQKGIVFLKMMPKRNLCTTPGQAKYLPFRDISEYVIKSVFGRESKDRDIYDFILSLIGHSYGTYASNFPAYSYLRFAYANALAKIPPHETNLGFATSRAHNNADLIKKMRQCDITITDLQRGFPTWENLQRKNVWDSVYHAELRNDFLH